MMYGDGWGQMGSWGWVGMLLMLLFWFGIIALFVGAMSGWRSGTGSATTNGPTGDVALTILRERLARGEVTTEEFERARKTLEESRR